MKPGLATALLGVVAIAVLPAAHAQSASEWRVTPYLWAAGFDGTVGTGNGGDAALGSRVAVDFGSLADNLTAAGAMLNIGWRQGRWSAFGDWTWVKVESDAPTGLPVLFTGVEAQVKGNVVQANLGYELVGNKDGRLDAFVGARYYDLDVEMRLEGLLTGNRAIALGQRWTDAVAGVRGSTSLGAAWEAYAQFDVGAGESDLSWQSMGVVGYRFGWGTVFGGWRHLAVDVQKGDYRLDAAISGPVVGASFRF